MGFRILYVGIIFCTVQTLCGFSLYGQDLEPRSITNIPIGTNFIVVSYAYSGGNVLLDPSLPIEDLDADLHSVIIGYARSIRLFGKSGKFDVILPYATGKWSALVNGMPESTDRSGFGDLRTKLSLNFIGGEILTREDFLAYKQKTFLGVSLRLLIPTGQYFPDKLINLGTNRWIFRPQLGFGQKIGKWTFEAYASLWLYTRNNRFYEGENTLTQDPFVTAKLHIIRTLNNKGMWVAADCGYGYGGVVYLNGDQRDSKLSTFRFGLTYALPINNRFSLKFFAQSGARLERGGDFDVFGIALQYRF